MSPTVSCSNSQKTIITENATLDQMRIELRTIGEVLCSVLGEMKRLNTNIEKHYNITSDSKDEESDEPCDAVHRL